MTAVDVDAAPGLRRLVTLAQAAWVADVLPATARKWASRGVLTPAAVIRGRKLYRAIDVLHVEATTRSRPGGGRRRAG